jgi:acetyltransferase-like isoleucine patch superfamily enzyme
LLGEESTVGPYAIIGEPPRNAQSGEFQTIIGPNAIIRSHSIIYAGNKIGRNFQTGHTVSIRENNIIGNDVSVGTHSIIEHHVIIQDDVRIHSGVFIPEFSTLEKGCWIGPHVVLTNALHPLCPDVKKCMKGPTIGKGSKIGANVTILPDVVIGEMSLIGAGSVVVTDIEPYVVASGNPARTIKRIEDITCRYQFRDHPYS